MVRDRGLTSSQASRRYVYLRLAQALADVATIAMIQDAVSADRQAVNERLQSALDTRVVLEQAKGVLAQIGCLGMQDAHDALVGYSRPQPQAGRPWPRPGGADRSAARSARKHVTRHSFVEPDRLSRVRISAGQPWQVL